MGSPDVGTGAAGDGIAAPNEPWRNGGRARCGARVDVPDGAHSEAAGSCAPGILTALRWGSDRCAAEPSRIAEEDLGERQVQHDLACFILDLDGMVPWILAAGGEHIDEIPGPRARFGGGPSPHRGSRARTRHSSNNGRCCERERRSEAWRLQGLIGRWLKNAPVVGEFRLSQFREAYSMERVQSIIHMG